MNRLDKFLLEVKQLLYDGECNYETLSIVNDSKEYWMGLYEDGLTSKQAVDQFFDEQKDYDIGP